MNEQQLRIDRIDSTPSQPHSLDESPIKENIPLQPIIRQSSAPRLQPIIKENGRLEPVKSNQAPRTVLFVEPPSKPHSSILINKDERHLYDSYSNNRTGIGSIKNHTEDSLSPHMYTNRSSYTETLSPYPDREPRYRSHLDDEGIDSMDPQFSSGSSNTLSRESGYCSPRHHLPLGSSNSYSRGPPPPPAPQESPQYSRGFIKPPPIQDESPKYSRGNFMKSPPTPQDKSPQYSRDNLIKGPPPPVTDTSMYNRNSLIKRPTPPIGETTQYSHGGLIKRPTPPKGETPPTTARDHHVFTFPASHSRSLDYSHPPQRGRTSPVPLPSIMKKSPSVSGDVSNYNDKIRPIDGSNTRYRSLPRPGKMRSHEMDNLLRYQSLDRRFDIPFTGSLPRQERRFSNESNNLEPTSRRRSSSTRLRFADEKLFHVYPEKNKRQNAVDDDTDENFV